MSTESPTEQMPATVYQWTEVLARIRFGTVKVGTRPVTGARIKLVAARLADYADPDGGNVRPGLARLSLDVEIDYRTAKASVAYLRSVGMLELVRSGGRTGVDVYRLTLPVDLLERDDLEVWSPARQKLEIERLSEAHRRLPRAPRKDSSQGHSAPVIDARSQGHPAPVEGSREPPITGAGCTANPSITGAGRAASQGQGAPATYQDQPTTTTNQPEQQLSTTSHPSRAKPTPRQCPEHHIPLKPRSDGLDACPLCRAGAPPTPIAPVIPLNSRRIS